MRRFRVIALTVIVVALVALPEPRASWQRKPQGRRPPVPRQITTRVVGDAYAPPWFSFRGHFEATSAPPLPDDPHDRGRALLRRGEISQAIPELRKAALNNDPAALTDLAAALIGQQDRLR